MPFHSGAGDLSTPEMLTIGLVVSFISLIVIFIITIIVVVYLVKLHAKK